MACQKKLVGLQRIWDPPKTHNSCGFLDKTSDRDFEYRGVHDWRHFAGLTNFSTKIAKPISQDLTRIRYFGEIEVSPRTRRYGKPRHQPNGPLSGSSTG